MKDLTIGKIAKRAKVKIETIRYYERFGLLPEPSRRIHSLYRQYDEDTVLRLQFIKNAKELGFSLKEISELLSLQVNPKSTCANVKKRAEIKIADIDEKIKTLQKIKKSLIKLWAQCKGKGPTSDCPILDAFSSKGSKNDAR